MSIKEILILFNLLNLPAEKIKNLILCLKEYKSEKLNLDLFSFLTEDEKEKLKKISQNVLDNELKLIKEKDIQIIDIFDQNYPNLLKQIHYPPIILYVKGDVKVLNEFSIAIVGTRLPTLYGLSIAEEFAYKLASFGIVIVSGLARGIDTAAHKGALRGGRTVAVLGSGLGNIYPKENKKLFEEILKKGAVVSEFPINYPPLKENFPRRNRIISGLSKGVLVIEAREKSGALITANYALEQNREVFAIPGNIDSPFSKGTHLLIKEGAKLVENVNDILEELNFKIEKKVDKIPLLDEYEKKIFDIINKEGIFLEDIIIKSGIDRNLVNSILLKLQLKGLIKEAKPLCFVRLV